MASTQDQVDRGCRGVAIWLGIIVALFAVCVAIGVGVFALNVRQWGGDLVREDLFPLIDQAQVPEAEKAALRTRVDGLIEAYRNKTLSQDDFIAEATALREDLVAKQPAPPEAPDGGAEVDGAEAR